MHGRRGSGTSRTAHSLRLGRRRSAGIARAAGLAVGVIGGLAGPVSASGAAHSRDALAARESTLQPRTTFSGRDFGGVLLDGAVTEGPIEFSASRAATWTEPAPVPEGPSPGPRGEPVRRLLLVGDARVKLGSYEFSAARAAVWMQKVDPRSLVPERPAIGAGDNAPIGDVYQVFVVFDRVGTPTADAAISVSADRLSVQGLVAPTAPVTLRVDLRSEGAPTDAFLLEAERVLARRLARELGGEPAGEPPAMAVDERDADRPGLARPYQQAAEDAAPSLDEIARAFPPGDGPEPIFGEGGVIAFSPGSEVVFQGDDTESAAILSGGVVVQYTDLKKGRTLQISAQRAVAFLDPGGLRDLARLGAGSVRGVYLEGDVVATQQDERGVQYTLRGPRVYYDVRRQRALVLDAVFWSYERKRGIPLYVRAKTIRQESASRFTATGALFTNSAFFEPHLAIGASTVTITRTDPPAVEPAGSPRPGQEVARAGQRGGAFDLGASDEPPSRDTRTLVTAENVTLNAKMGDGRLPFGYFPFFRGDPERAALRDLQVDTSSSSGGAIKTTWDPLALLDVPAPEGLSTEVLIDGYFRRGVGLGADLEWKGTASEGSFFAYTLPHDDGRDVLASGARRDRDGDFRSLVLGEHRHRLNDRWTLFAELANVSDENFTDAFFSNLAAERREFANSLYLSRLEDNTLATFELRGQLNDFTPNEYLLQSQGYNVERLPEARYLRTGDDLLGFVRPGLLSYTGETRLGYLELSFTEPTADELGFDTPARSQAALGIQPDESIADVLRARGFSEEGVLRFDTRHELSSSFEAGPVKLTPFTVGRVTAYDQDFEAFSGTRNEPFRLWGSLGARAYTTIQRVDNSVESRFFDLHRVRHILEPSVTAWHAGSTIDQGELPLYDDAVESLADGSVARVGLLQTWQTQRGGAGRWRSVDVFKLNVDYVVASGDADRESPIRRFVEYSPELSNLGEFLDIDAAWQFSDAVTLTGEHIYDFEIGQPARTTAGLLLQHTPDFATFAEIRYINSQDSTYVDFGAEYRLSTKYTFSGSATYDTDIGDIQSVTAGLERRFPNATLGLIVRFNNISEETSFGLIFQPLGARGGVRLRGLGSGELGAFGG